MPSNKELLAVAERLEIHYMPEKSDRDIAANACRTLAAAGEGFDAQYGARPASTELIGWTHVTVWQDRKRVWQAATAAADAKYEDNLDTANIEELIEFFRNEFADEGRRGDDNDLTTEQCAIRVMREQKEQVAKHEARVRELEAEVREWQSRLNDADANYLTLEADLTTLAATARTALQQRDAAVGLLLQLKAERRHNRIFLASKQQIKQPEGTALYDELTADMDAFLAQVGKGGA